MVNINLTGIHALATAFDSFGEEGFGNNSFKISTDTFASFKRSKFIPSCKKFINILQINCPNNVVLTIEFMSGISKKELAELLSAEIQRLGAMYKAQYATIAMTSFSLHDFELFKLK